MRYSENNSWREIYSNTGLPHKTTEKDYIEKSNLIFIPKETKNKQNNKQRPKCLEERK